MCFSVVNYGIRNMKKVFVLVLLFCCFVVSAAEDDEEIYIVVSATYSPSIGMVLKAE